MSGLPSYRRQAASPDCSRVMFVDVDKPTPTRDQSPSHAPRASAVVLFAPPTCVRHVGFQLRHHDARHPQIERRQVRLPRRRRGKPGRGLPLRPAEIQSRNPETPQPFRSGGSPFVGGEVSVGAGRVPAIFGAERDAVRMEPWWVQAALAAFLRNPRANQRRAFTRIDFSSWYRLMNAS